MLKNKSKYSSRKNIAIGDLVYHVLYGKDWVGVVLSFKDSKTTSDSTNHREMVLVKIVPGTKHETFFKTRVDKKSNSMGYISMNWLFKLEEVNGET